MKSATPTQSASSYASTSPSPTTAHALLLSTATKAVDGLIEILCRKFAEGEPLYLRGLGTFDIIERSPRPARNISTGEVIQIPARLTVRFRPCRQLKERLNPQLTADE